MSRKIVLKKGVDNPVHRNLTEDEQKQKEERDSRVAERNEQTQQRVARDSIVEILQKSDYTQLSDFKGDRTQWGIYRQKLREILKQDTISEEDIPDRPYT